MSELFSEYFTTTRRVPLTVPDLTPVGEDVMRHFQGQEYQVSGTRLAGGGWHISIHRGDWFRTILGLKTALNIRIEPQIDGTLVTAGIGIFELQVIPVFITVFVFAPVILTQIWGILQQHKLDEEAVQYVEDRLSFYGGVAPYAARTTPPAPPPYDPARSAAEQELGDFNPPTL